MSALKRKEVRISADACKGCQLCIISCKHDCLAVGDVVNRLGYRSVVMLKPEACTGCANCARMCPDAVIEVWVEE